MDDYITKPIDERELYAALVKWITSGQREIARPRVPAQTVATQWDDMPTQIPGIDLKKALARVYDDSGLYQKMLRAFLEKFDSAGDLIGQYLN
jgi:DNA-binding response OmpR family regulator